MHPTPVWDHVVINTQDRTDEAVAAFEKLGFTKYVKGKGGYEKTAGSGPELIRKEKK